MLEPKRLDLYPHGLEGFHGLAYGMLALVLTAFAVYTAWQRGWL